MKGEPEKKRSANSCCIEVLSCVLRKREIYIPAGHLGAKLRVGGARDEFDLVSHLIEHIENNFTEGLIVGRADDVRARVVCVC